MGFGSPLNNTDDKYTFPCAVKIINKPYLDHLENGTSSNQSGNMAFLVPEQSTELVKFLNKYLPISTEKKNAQSDFECLAELKDGIIPHHARVHLCLKDKYISEHHFMVASRYSEEMLTKLDGKRLLVSVLPELTPDQEDKLET